MTKQNARRGGKRWKLLDYNQEIHCEDLNKGKGLEQNSYEWFCGVRYTFRALTMWKEINVEKQHQHEH